MMGSLTAEEEKCILELKNLLKNDVSKEMYEDTHMFYKFSKARNFKVTQAESMLRKHLEWRKYMQIDTILTDYTVPEVLRKYVPQDFLGFDKEHCPIRFSLTGRFDGIGVFRSANKIDFLKCMLYVVEADIKNMKLQSKKVGKQIKQLVFIYSYDKLTFSQATHRTTIEQLMKMISNFQDNYPELLKAIYIINVPAHFSIVFSILKTVIAGPVLDKMRVFGKEGWKEELLKGIDANVLPVFLGGTRTDPDGNPQCETFINYAGKVPESYYLEKNIEKFAKKEGVLKTVVDRFSSFEVRIGVEEEDSILEWEYELTSNDIGFSLSLEESDAQVKKLLPMYKFSTEYEPIRGMFRCQRQGTYIISFDNTYSWFYTKEVYYKVWIRNKEK